MKDIEQTTEAIYIVLGFVTIALNAIAIVFIVKSKKKLKLHEKFLVSLACSDLLVAVLVTAFKLIDISFSDAVDILREDKFSVLLSLSVMLSITNLVIITLDRFLAVKYPLKHRALSPVVRTNLIIAVVWLVEVGKLVALLYLSLTRRVDEDTLLYVTAVSIILFGSLMTAIYCYIVHKSCTRRTLLNANGGKSHAQIVNSFFSEGFKKERNIFYTCCLINFTFIISSYPFAIQYFIMDDLRDESFTITRMMLFLNSTINPLIYFFKGYLESRRADNSVAVHQRR